MSILFAIRPKKLLTISMLALGTHLVTPYRLAYSDEPSQQQTTTEKSRRSDQKASNVVDQHADDESAALGVVVGSCPGVGVCVLDTVWNSPADEAGIRQGDYILSIDGKEVSSPGELAQFVDKVDADKKVSLTVWRQGKEIEMQVMLASTAKELPVSHHAWLGVKISSAEDQGARIEKVMRDSPAAQAGLRSGDMIVKQGEKEVKSADSFVESVEDMGPGADMRLTVLRDGNEMEVGVKLGHIHEAPMQFFRHSMRPMINDQSMSAGQNYDNGASEMLDETLDELRQQIRELRNQFQEFIGDSKERPKADADDDLSQDPNQIGSNDTMLVVQRDWRGYGNSNRGRNRDNDFYDWDSRYRSSYRYPTYQSPRYGNSYYRYQGRPYYGNFGRRYGSGRSGVQIGNFGVYWY